MKKKITLVFAVSILVLMTSGTMDWDGIAGRAGSPTEKVCNECHSGNPLNAAGGSVTITSPTLTNWNYALNQTYTINVTVARTGIKLFGLGFEAIASDGSNAGTLTAGNGTTLKSATVGGKTRTSITHLKDGGLSTTNSHTFTFTWKAPATDIGKITFYCAANAADANNEKTNDFIYTTSQIVTSPSSVAIAEQIAFSKQISIYPNPATNYLQITNSNSWETMTVSILDMKGALISRKYDITVNDLIELNDLNAGSYLLHVETEGKTAIKKFIKQ